jgi:hypothetical protein
VQTVPLNCRSYHYVGIRGVEGFTSILSHPPDVFSKPNTPYIRRKQSHHPLPAPISFVHHIALLTAHTIAQQLQNPEPGVSQIAQIAAISRRGVAPFRRSASHPLASRTASGTRTNNTVQSDPIETACCWACATEQYSVACFAMQRRAYVHCYAITCKQAW